MNIARVMSNADAKIKLMRVMEYLCLVAEDYMNPSRDKEISADLIYCHNTIKSNKKLLRILFSLWNLKKILIYQNKDKLQLQKILYIISKSCGIIFYFNETLTGILEHAGLWLPLSKRLRRIQINFWIIGLLISNIYCMTYLIHSYGKEAHLKDVSINKLKPTEIITIMRNLADERHRLIIHICCNFMDMFIGFHYSQIIEKVFRTRASNGVLGSVGAICTLLRIVALLTKRNHYSTGEIAMFDGQFYGYD